MKNIFKKLVSLLMAICMIWTIAPVNVLAATELTIAAGSISANLVAGETVTIDINLTSNPGIVGGVVKVEWDKTAFELVGVSETDATIKGAYLGQKAFPVTSGSYALSWDGDLETEDNISTGLLGKLTFKILDGAKAQDYEVKVTKIDFTNFDLDSVEGKGVSGKITLTELPKVELIIEAGNANADLVVGNTVTVDLNLT
ncbi:MAG: hypothetical protein IKZ06_00185, partial [Oscillospiraceae bacterium]|nr:hypothetical protein [Oscillospiraceae bacterium]